MTNVVLRDLIELLIEDTRWAPQRSDTPLTMESPTTAVPSVVAASITQLTSPLWLHLGINSEAFFTHVGQCSECKGLLEHYMQLSETAVQGVPEMDVEWIFPKLASGEFAKEPEAVKFELQLFKCPEGDTLHTGHVWWRYIPNTEVAGVAVRESWYCTGTMSDEAG